MDKTAIKLLTEILTLDDDIFRALLHQIIVPSLHVEFRCFVERAGITYKELYVSILTNQTEEILNMKKYDVDEVVAAKNRLAYPPKNEYGYNREDDENLIHFFKIMAPADFRFQGGHTSDEDMKYYVEKYNTIVSTLLSCKNFILSQISTIAIYFEQYKIRTTRRTELTYKNLLTKILLYIFDYQRLCFLYPGHVIQVRFLPYEENKDCRIIKDYKLIYDNDCFYITNDKQCKVPVKIKKEKLVRDNSDNSYCIMYFSDHTYINSKLNKAIDEFNAIEDSSFCPICNPIRLNKYPADANEKAEFSQMCKACKGIIKIIKLMCINNAEAKKKYTTKLIRERVKAPNKIEETWTPEKRKKHHFEKFNEIVDELLEKYNEQKDDIEYYKENYFNRLMQRQFPEFYND